MTPENISPRRDPSTIATIVFLLWGLIIWGLQFSITYIGHTWLCARGGGETASTVLIGGATVLALGLIAPVVAAPERLSSAARLEPGKPDTVALITIARLIGILSAIAAIWTGATAAIVQACVAIR